MCSGGGDGGAAQARADEQARQARVREGMDKINKNFYGFDEPFYRSRAKAYEDFANPQLEEQYNKQEQNLAYNLARSGLTSSSEAARNAGEIQRQYNTGRAAIAAEGINQSNAARRAVEENRADLIAQLNATGDARAAASGALNRANMLQQQMGFSPIGNLFQATTGLLGNAAQAGYYDRNAPGLGAFGLGQPGRTSASRVVN